MLFSRKHKEIQYHTGYIEYPSGCAVHTHQDEYLYKLNGKWYKFGSHRAFESWSLLASEATPQNLGGIEVVGVLGFREGSLLSKFSDGKLYLVSENKTRHITDPDALDRYGLLGRKIWEVSDREFKLHARGEDLSG